MMNIGEAAQASGVSAKMIRYYESIRVTPPPAREANGYRAYTEADVRTLQFIRRARDLGFSIDQIRQLVGLWRDPRRSSAKVKQIALAHVAELKQKIREMQSMTAALDMLARHCHGDHKPDCPILEDLEGARPRKNAATTRAVAQRRGKGGKRPEIRSAS